MISTQAATAGDLLKQYGGAYLLTSTSFAIVSFAICYALVSNGVDVAGLLGKIGIEPSQNAQTGGTFAIATRGAQGRVAHPVPADGRADAGRGEDARERGRRRGA